jgi:dUTP pyrophosphatase
MKKRLRGFEVLPEFMQGDIQIPQRGTSLSAGYDLAAFIDQPWRILPGSRTLIPTGLTAYMQDDEEVQIRTRSGLAFKNGLVVLNSPGTIDADYYGKHIHVLLFNSSIHEFLVNPGDRIAQAIFSKYLKTDDDTPARLIRNGGFGHTGV